MKKHYATFLSPGTFVHEQTTREVPSWDVDHAVGLARSITERHGATPFAFYFTTRMRGDFDSHETAKSGRYYLGGVALSIDDVRERADPGERVLLANMESNGWDRIIVNTNSWRIVQPLEEDDTVLEYEVAS